MKGANMDTMNEWGFIGREYFRGDWKVGDAQSWLCARRGSVLSHPLTILIVSTSHHSEEISLSYQMLI